MSSISIKTDCCSKKIKHRSGNDKKQKKQKKKYICKMCDAAFENYNYKGKCPKCPSCRYFKKKTESIIAEKQQQGRLRRNSLGEFPRFTNCGESPFYILDQLETDKDLYLKDLKNIKSGTFEYKAIEHQIKLINEDILNIESIIVQKYKT
tara:strand:+ start:267 stop:716 length:450 start_codon:yes stop_codon:yes gene_type:complete